MKLVSIDLFSGCGGLTEGMHQAGFQTKLAFEINNTASLAYEANHPTTKIIKQDIRSVNIESIKKELSNTVIHLLAGCPPCQGFSSLRRLNRKEPVSDQRNSLILEYIKFVKELNPYTIMLENVPALIEYDLFQDAVRILRDELHYFIDYDIVNVKDYGVPQSRKRLVMIGSKLGEIKIPKPNNEKVTVREAIGLLPHPSESTDPLHKIFPKHTPHIQERIRLTPKNGGSRKDLPEEYQLECHKKDKVGFNDIYGRLKWDWHSTTITGGCLNPSKGRFLHPEQDRCISAREAAILQSFPSNYIFPSDITKTELALMIGNALPPKFSFYQSQNIKDHLISHGIN